MTPTEVQWRGRCSFFGLWFLFRLPPQAVLAGDALPVIGNIIQLDTLSTFRFVETPTISNLWRRNTLMFHSFLRHHRPQSNSVGSRAGTARRSGCGCHGRTGPREATTTSAVDPVRVFLRWPFVRIRPPAFSSLNRPEIRFGGTSCPADSDASAASSSHVFPNGPAWSISRKHQAR